MSTSLETLHTAIIDARAGYEKAIEEAEDTGLKALFGEIDALHAKAHADIHKVLGARGEDADDDGSFMSTVHKAVISVRSAMTGMDREALPSFAEGEERIVGSYDDAIGDETGDVAAMLDGHRKRLIAMIARMNQVAEGAAAA